VSPDGQLLVAAGADVRGGGGASVWELSTGELVGKAEGHRGPTQAAAFSADGKLLATGGRDCTVLLWSVGRVLLRPLWADLRGGEPPSDNKAIAAALARRLRELAGAAGRARALLPGLDDDDFATRERASRDLGLLGQQAEPALRQALAEGPSLEARRRIEELLRRLAGGGPTTWSAGKVRAAVLVLERLEGPDGRQALDELARGPAGDLVSRAAREAVARRGR
jgi:hypothetical protein